MNKSVLAGIIVLILMLAGGGLLLANKDGDDTATDSTMSSESSMKMDESTSNTQTTSSSDATTKAPNSIEIRDYAYSPNDLTIKKGTTITWTNQDSVKHDVMTDVSGKGPSSELLAKGESYSYTFDEVGTFSYHCSPHPYMKGSITVTE